MKPPKRSFIPALCLILCLALLPLNVSAEDGGAAVTGLDVPDTVDWATGSDRIYSLSDGRAVPGGSSYEIPDGGVAMLIFFGAGGADSQALFSALAETEWIADPRLSISAFEANGAARDQVQSFMADRTGASQAYFRTFYGYGCSSVMRKYFALMSGGDSLAWPLVLLICERDGTPTVRFASAGAQDVSGIGAAADALYAEAEELGSWTVTWEWSEDLDSARAVFTSDAGVRRSVDADVLRRIRPETCDEPGKAISEATAVFGGRSYRDTTVSPIPARGHTEGETVRENIDPGSCVVEGHFDEVVRCSTCNKELSRRTVYTGYGEHAPGDPGRENIVAATYSTEGGYDTVTYCTLCKRELKRESTVVPVLTFRFDDVKGPGAYFYAPVYWALENNITKGTTEKTFSPDTPCTRAQIVTFLWRAAGRPEPGSTDDPFKDVKESDWFLKPVLWAVENGITTGTSPMTFSPNASCTRAQTLAFLWRANGSPEPGSTENPFTDVKESDWFFKPVLWAVENGIAGGSPGSAFSPNSPCTRGQGVTFLWRASGSPEP